MPTAGQTRRWTARRSAKIMPGMDTHRLAGIVVALLCVMHSGCASEDTISHIRDANALGPYSGAVLTDDLVFISGKIGDRSGTFEHEVTTALQAVADELAGAGVSFDDVVVATVYLTDMNNYAAFNEIYADVVGDPYPARAVVEVAALPGNAQVEVMVTAVRR